MIRNVSAKWRSTKSLRAWVINIYYWPDMREKDETLEDIQVEKPTKVEHSLTQKLEI
jgi:hypothetical protein